MVEKDAVAGKHPIGLTVITGEVKSGDFGNSVRGARVEGGFFVLGGFNNLAEHFGGGGEIKLAVWSSLFYGGEHVMCTADIRVDGREFIVKRVADVTLSSKVVALLGLELLNYLEERCIAFQRGSVESDLAENRLDPGEVTLRILKCNATDKPVNLVAFAEEKLGEE
jgi:hypothetical protein